MSIEVCSLTCEAGLTVWVHQAGEQYKVTMRDDDSGNVIPFAKLFRDRDQAIAFAERCAMV